MSKRDPRGRFMKFYGEKWHTSPTVLRMGLGARGLLIELAWFQFLNGDVSSDPLVCARMIGAELSDVQAHWDEAMKAFEIDGDSMRCAFVDELHAEAAEESEKRSTTGRRNAEKRWGKRAENQPSGTESGEWDASGMQAACDSHANGCQPMLEERRGEESREEETRERAGARAAPSAGTKKNRTASKFTASSWCRYWPEEVPVAEGLRPHVAEWVEARAHGPGAKRLRVAAARKEVEALMSLHPTDRLPLLARAVSGRKSDGHAWRSIIDACRSARERHERESRGAQAAPYKPPSPAEADKLLGSLGLGLDGGENGAGSPRAGTSREIRRLTQPEPPSAPGASQRAAS